MRTRWSRWAPSSCYHRRQRDGSRRVEPTSPPAPEDVAAPEDAVAVLQDAAESVPVEAAEPEPAAASPPCGVRPATPRPRSLAARRRLRAARLRPGPVLRPARHAGPRPSRSPTRYRPRRQQRLQRPCPPRLRRLLRPDPQASPRCGRGVPAADAAAGSPRGTHDHPLGAQARGLVRRDLETVTGTGVTVGGSASRMRPRPPSAAWVAGPAPWAPQAPQAPQAPAGRACGRGTPAGPAASRRVARPAPAAQPPTAQPPADRRPALPVVPSSLRGTTQRMSRPRQVIAQRMVELLRVSAQLTTVVEADATAIARLRDRAKADFEAREGVKLDLPPVLRAGRRRGPEDAPEAQRGDRRGPVTYHDAEHLGVAVDTERGLMVPVIHKRG